MKKLFILSGIIFTLFLLIILITTTNKNQETNEKEITTEELQKEISTQKEHFVYFYQTDCIYCKATSPIIIPMAEEMKIDLKKLNLQEDPAGWDEFHIEGTPTIIYYNNGKEVDRIFGQQTDVIFENWFKKHK
jgi:thioredoxin-like negative regulator of GroEL